METKHCRSCGAVATHSLPWGVGAAAVPLCKACCGRWQVTIAQVKVAEIEAQRSDGAAWVARQTARGRNPKRYAHAA